METQYHTIIKQVEDEFVEKRSRFICAISPATTVEEANEFLTRQRQQHHDARHTVFAYALRQGGVFRYSDDGEPQGTGGIPVLEVIKRNNLTDVCVAITRYFGGTLLGAGGLTRAYAGGAALAINAATIITFCQCADCLITIDYPMYNNVSRLLPDFGAMVLESDFAADVSLLVRLKIQEVANLEQALIELTNAKATFTVMEKVFAAL